MVVIYNDCQNFCRLSSDLEWMRSVAWVPLLACPAVFLGHALLDKPARAPLPASLPCAPQAIANTS